MSNYSVNVRLTLLIVVRLSQCGDFEINAINAHSKVMSCLYINQCIFRMVGENLWKVTKYFRHHIKIE